MCYFILDQESKDQTKVIGISNEVQEMPEAFIREVFGTSLGSYVAVYSEIFGGGEGGGD